MTAAPQFPRVGADDDEIARRRYIPKEAQPALIVSIRHHLYRDGYFSGTVHLDTRTPHRSMLILICQTGRLWG